MPNDWNAIDFPVILSQALPFYDIDDFSLLQLLHDRDSHLINVNPNSLNIEYDVTSNDKYLSSLNNCHNEVDLLKALDIRNANKCSIVNLDQITISHGRLDIVHLNVRSLVAHHSELEITLERMGNPAVVGLSETWLRPYNEALYSIPGYNLFPVSRANKTGVGVAILVLETVKCSPRNDLSDLLNHSVEAIFLEVEGLLVGGNKVLIGELYRPPGGS